MQSELFIIGAGGFASDFIACFKNEFIFTGCWDDNLKKGSEFNGIPVLGTINELASSDKDCQVVITIASPAARFNISQKFLNTNHRFPAIIHPSASIFDKETVKIGQGCIIFPSVLMITQISLGDFAVLHVGSSVHHNVDIGNCSVIMPGARLTGDVTIGKNVFIGPNQTLSHGVVIMDSEQIK